VKTHRGRNGYVARDAPAIPHPAIILVYANIEVMRCGTGLVQASTELHAQATPDWNPRSRAEVELFFAGMEIVPPYEGAEPAVTHLGV